MVLKNEEKLPKTFGDIGPSPVLYIKIFPIYYTQDVSFFGLYSSYDAIETLKKRAL